MSWNFAPSVGTWLHPAPKEGIDTMDGSEAPACKRVRLSVAAPSQDTRQELASPRKSVCFSPNTEMKSMGESDVLGSERAQEINGIVDVLPENIRDSFSTASELAVDQSASVLVPSDTAETDAVAEGLLKDVIGDAVAELEVMCDSVTEECAADMPFSQVVVDASSEHTQNDATCVPDVAVQSKSEGTAACDAISGKFLDVLGHSDSAVTLESSEVRSAITESDRTVRELEILDTTALEGNCEFTAVASAVTDEIDAAASVALYVEEERTHQQVSVVDWTLMPSVGTWLMPLLPASEDVVPSKSKLAPSSPTTPLSVRADSALARSGRAVATPESRSKRVAQVQGKVLLFQTPTSKKILCTEELEALEIEEKRRELQQLRAQNNCMVERARAARAKEAEHKKILAEKEHKGPGLRKTSPSACPKAVRPKDVAEQKKSGDLRVRGATPVKHVPEKKVESARVRAATPQKSSQTSGMRSKPADKPAQREIATQGSSSRVAGDLARQGVDRTTRAPQSPRLSLGPRAATPTSANRSIHTDGQSPRLSLAPARAATPTRAPRGTPSDASKIVPASRVRTSSVPRRAGSVTRAPAQAPSAEVTAPATTTKTATSRVRSSSVPRQRAGSVTRAPTSTTEAVSIAPQPSAQGSGLRRASSASRFR